LLHDETHLTKIADELCKTVLKLGSLIPSQAEH